MQLHTSKWFELSLPQPRTQTRLRLRRLLSASFVLLGCGSSAAPSESETEPGETRSAVTSTAGLDDPILFDAQYYRSQYPDLQAACATDANCLRNHWLNNGIAEGRRASPILDSRLYLNYITPGLKIQCGSDLVCATRFFLTSALAAGIRGSIEFDPQYYLTRYPDLAAAYGKTGYVQAARHYVSWGLWQEGRAGSNEFDVSYYICHYSDLAGSFPANFRGAAYHFGWQYLGVVGPAEGRRASVFFDVRTYISRNGLSASDFAGAWRHWFASGSSKNLTGDPLDAGGTWFCSPTPAAPPAPANFKLGTNTANSLSITWSDVASETFYVVKRSSANGGATMSAQTHLSQHSTGYTFTSLTSGASYCFEVLACDAFSHCGAAKNVCATPVPPAPVRRGATSQLVGINSTSATAQLTWTPVTSATYYKVRSIPTKGTTTEQTVTGATATLSLELNKQYSYNVAACNAGGCSAYTSMGGDVTPPSPPTGLRATWQNQGTNHAMKVYWNTVTGAHYYSIQQTRLSDNSTSAWRAGLTRTDDEWNWLQPSTTYLYTVVACSDLGGCSAPAYVSQTVGSQQTTGLINITLQMSGSDPVSCANSSTGFWVDGSYYGQASGTQSSSGGTVTCDINKPAAPLTIKNHWVCSQWIKYCCKCQTLTSTDYTPTTTLVGSDCGFDSTAAPSTCK